MQPQRRAYSKSFKTQVIQECSQLGASIADVALSHSLNANLVHKWIRVQTQQSMGLQPAFVPLPMQLAGAESQAASSNICIEIQQPRGTVTVSLPGTIPIPLPLILVTRNVQLHSVEIPQFKPCHLAFKNTCPRNYLAVCVNRQEVPFCRVDMPTCIGYRSRIEGTYDQW